MENYIEKIQEKIDVEHGHRLGIAFATRNKKYMYDTGTGKVFECEENEYKILKELFDNNKLPDSLMKVNEIQLQEAYENIWCMVENEHIILNKRKLILIRLREPKVRKALFLVG